MRHSLTALLLVPALVSAQELHTFKNGEVADADKLNESLQYILNNASGGGGCSATQQDNSVVIECADGTSGVIAGAGTVALPSGFTGEVDVSELNSGDIVLVDGNHIVLAQYKGRYSDSGYVFSLSGNTDSPGPYEAVLINAPSESVELLHYPLIHYTAPYPLYFLGANDCNDPSATVLSGLVNVALLEESAFKKIIMAPNGKYYVYTGEKLGQTLFSTAYVPEPGEDSDTGWQWTCQQGEFISSPGVLVEFTFPPEILNAAYPVRLEQLP